MTQREMVLRFMRENGSITPWKAMRELGCMWMGARMWELKNAGIAIITERKTRRNRYGKRTTYARYRLA